MTMSQVRRGINVSQARVILTGAAGGLGMATATALSDAGAHVVGIDRRPGAGLICADVTKPDEIAGAVQEAGGQLGGIDILINNAGLGWAQRSGEPADEDAREMIEVNLFGAWNTTAAALPDLLARSGHVVNVASGIAILSMPYGAAYSVSKRALPAYSDVLRLEYRGRLAVTTLYPGYLETGIHNRNAAQGYSVGDAIPADSLPTAARAVVRACRRRPRDAFTSLKTNAALRTARIWPAPLEIALRNRLIKAMSAKPAPD